MATPRSALVVDDERDIRELLVLTLGRMGLRVDTAADLASARAQLAQASYDLCLTDMRLPDGSGQELIEHIAQKYADIPVAMITAFGNVEAAVQALKPLQAAEIMPDKALTQSFLVQYVIARESFDINAALAGAQRPVEGLVKTEVFPQLMKCENGAIGACGVMRNLMRRVLKAPDGSVQSIDQ